jgi:DNA-binding transcriptional LysR family regulator
MNEDRKTVVDFPITRLYDVVIALYSDGNRGSMQLSDRVGRRLKLHDLHVLMATVKAGSMNKAAAILNTTQPAISKSVADLEHAMGVRLLERKAQGVEPTQYGHALLKRCVTVFDELREGVRDIEFLADPTVGEVRVGSTEPLAAGLLPFVVARLNRRYPRIRSHIDVQPNFGSLERVLRARDIDLMIARALGPISEGMNTETLFRDRLLFVAGPKSPWARRRKIGLADLQGEPWTLPPEGSVPRSLIVQAFRAAGIDPPRPVNSGFPIALHVALVATGRFLAVIPESQLRFSSQMPVHVLPVDIQIPFSPVVIVTLKDRMLSPVAARFIACVRETVKPLAKE